jgi:hypothetical protein
MRLPGIELDPTEKIIAQAAAQFYAAYITSGRVSDGEEKDWMRRSLREAVGIVKAAEGLAMTARDTGSADRQSATSSEQDAAQTIPVADNASGGDEKGTTE